MNNYHCRWCGTILYTLDGVWVHFDTKSMWCSTTSWTKAFPR